MTRFRSLLVLALVAALTLPLSAQTPRRGSVTVYADGVTPASSDTILTVSWTQNGVVVGSGVTTVPITSGRTLRLTAISLTFTSSTTTANKVMVRLRAGAVGGGSCTVSSPLVAEWELALPVGTLAANQGADKLHVTWPEGLDLFGGERNFCFSAIAAASNGTLTVTAMGYKF